MMLWHAFMFLGLRLFPLFASLLACLVVAIAFSCKKYTVYNWGKSARGFHQSNLRAWYPRRRPLLNLLRCYGRRSPLLRVLVP
jgi:hypothetical protein